MCTMHSVNILYFGTLLIGYLVLTQGCKSNHVEIKTAATGDIALNQGTPHFKETAQRNKSRNENYLQSTRDTDTKYVTKQIQRYRGLINQGATCYLNSALQMLFFVKSFCRSVFQIPVFQEELKKGSLSLECQRLLYNMQFSTEDAVSTENFTKHFTLYNEPLNVSEQQDAMEFIFKFLDDLSTLMRGTEVEDDIVKLFGFEASSYSAPYMLFLGIRGNDNIYDSLKAYVENDQLVYKSLPSVLFLELKRFDYDWDLEQAVKLIGRLEYPVELNLTEFKQNFEAEDDQNDLIYVLQSVLVHTALNGYGSHNYVYSNPKCDGKWFKFDDEKVTAVDFQEVTENSFGKVNGTTTPFPDSTPVAYVLVYIRKGETQEILEDVTMDDIPLALKELINVKDN